MQRSQTWGAGGLARLMRLLALGALAALGFGCQCHTALRQPEPLDDCGEVTEERLDHARQAARERANRWIELAEYPPASLAPTRALAVISYPQEEGSLGRRSFVYDDALALLWFAWTGDERKARGLAETLIFLQNPDGSWGFSFGVDHPDDYHASYVRNGTVAWAAHALAYFGERYGHPRAIRASKRSAQYLRQMRLGGDALHRGLISAGRGAPASPPDAEVDEKLPYAVTEHQLDAYMVLEHYEPMAAQRLAERMLEVLWLAEEGRFAVAAAGDHLNTRRALDAAGAWGTLWLLSIGERERARRSYEYTLDQFRSEGAALYGFKPYVDEVDGYVPGEADDHIFVEGSMSLGLAAWRLGDQRTADRVLHTGIQLGCRGEPGVPYSNVEVVNYSTKPAAASTLWFLFLDREMATGMTAPVF